MFTTVPGTFWIRFSNGFNKQTLASICGRTLRGNINEHMKCKIFMSQNVPLFIKMKIFTAKSNITSTKKNHFYMKIPLAVGRNLCLKPF